jgi:DNA repair protein RecO (recombination protein O)|tara:strand:- start:674 stop:1354 length:681 start_codon:yes stop_codon:yes gene_type:complete
MHWKDTGYLLSKNQFNENSAISEVFTKNHGKISGIIFGASSKKTKNYLQLGNKLHLNFYSKNDSRVGNIKIEIEEALTPFFFDNKQKLACIVSAMNLVKLLTVESQENINIYNLINNLFLLLKKIDWLKDFVFWELQLLKLIGYDLELKNIVDEEIVNGKKNFFVQRNNEKKFIPNFLIENENNQTDNKNIISGLKLVGDYLEKSILKPNNISFPVSRIEFINMIK